MKIKPEKKVRLCNGPFVPQAMRTDLFKRAAKNDTSVGIELEKDWEYARSHRLKLSQSPGST